MRKMSGVLMMALSVTTVSLSFLAASAVQPEEETAPEKDRDESVEIRFARAHLEIAELDLESAMAMNSKVPNLFPVPLLESLRLHVEIDHAQLDRMLNGEGSGAHGVRIRSAEVSVTIAEADVKRLRGFSSACPRKPAPLT